MSNEKSVCLWSKRQASVHLSFKIKAKPVTCKNKEKDYLEMSMNQLVREKLCALHWWIRKTFYHGNHIFGVSTDVMMPVTMDHG